MDVRWTIAALDVLAASESRYRPHAAGDCPGLRPGSPACTRELGAISCGAYQTPCSRTPDDALGQARLAESAKTCPEHPLWAYASGHCAPSAIALRYETAIRRELAVPPLVAP